MEHATRYPHVTAESKNVDPLDNCRDCSLYPRPETPEWFDEPGGVYGYAPYGHTPLDPYGSSEVIKHQNYFKDQIGALAQTPPREYPDHIVEIFNLDFQAGIHHRETKSMANFNDWLTNHPDEVDAIQHEPTLNWYLGEALAGRGKPGGLLRILQHAPSMRSLDLQVLTTPYGYRREHIPEMRKQLREAVVGIDGYYNAEGTIEPEKIKIAPHFGINDEGLPQLDAILATYKRRVGVFYADTEHQTDAINIVERHAIVMSVDEASGFPQDIVNLYTTATDRNDNRQRATKRVSDLILAQEPNEFMTPNSIMTYAYRLNVPEQPAADTPKFDTDGQFDATMYHAATLEKLLGEKGMTLEEIIKSQR